MFSKVDYVMVNVSDMRRSVAFYRDTLGLRLKFESPAWSEFETGATTLALHAGTRAAGSEAATQAGPEAGTCSLGFSVPDLNSTYAELRERGARFVMPPTEQAKRRYPAGGVYRPRRLDHLVCGTDGTRGNRPGMTTRPNIGLQRTSVCGLAAEPGSIASEGRMPGITAQEVMRRCGVS